MDHMYRAYCKRLTKVQTIMLPCQVAHRRNAGTNHTSVTTHTPNVSIINQKFARLPYQHQPPPPSAPFLPSPPSLMACSRHPAKSQTCRLLFINCYPLYGGGMPGRWTSLLSHIVGSRKGTYPHTRRDCFCLQLFNHVLCQVRAHVSPCLRDAVQQAALCGSDPVCQDTSGHSGHGWGITLILCRIHLS